MTENNEYDQPVEMFDFSEEALSKAKLELNEEQLELAKDEASRFYHQCIESGRTEAFAGTMANHRLSTFFINLGIENLKMARMIPLEELVKEFAKKGKDWNGLSKENQRKVLWDLGINTKINDFFIKSCCFNWNDKVKCGVAIIGDERTDDEWLNQLDDDGCNVASMDVRCKDLKGIKEVSRNSKNWDNIAIAVKASGGVDVNGKKVTKD